MQPPGLDVRESAIHRGHRSKFTDRHVRKDATVCSPQARAAASRLALRIPSPSARAHTARTHSRTHARNHPATLQ
eukprot:1897980-Pleurochrysis_carterae.AAC.1